MIKDNGEFSESFLLDSSNGREGHSYFAQLGISKSILEEYFNLLTEASRKNTFSVVEGKNNEVIVFEEVIDTLSFLQLLKLNEQQNNRTLITLNTATDLADFINNYQNFNGKIFLCLNCSTISNELTQKIKAELKMPSIKDIRSLYGIIEGKNANLNDYLLNKLEIKRTKSTLHEIRKSKNELTSRSRTVSNPESVERQPADKKSNNTGGPGKSQQDGDLGGRYNVGGEDAGNGFAKQAGFNGRSPGRNRSADDNEQPHIGKIQEYPLGRGLLESTNIPDLDLLLEQYHGKKLSNSDILKVVSTATSLNPNDRIDLVTGLKITDSLRNIVAQFESGGTSKKGRGILDEYYTDPSIVQAVRNLVKDHFKGSSPISILEPSVGTGNFLSLERSLAVKASITAFEINETSARIAKILYPETEINLRSFETEFISDDGLKTLPQHFRKYDLIVGNPPYGEHRGLYKGLGEENKISRYED